MPTVDQPNRAKRAPRITAAYAGVLRNPASLRSLYAADVCECGHARRRHYAQDGSSRSCRAASCTCGNYAWRDRPPSRAAGTRVILPGER